MKAITFSSIILASIIVAGRVWAHGFNLSVDNYYDPTTILVSSASDYLDPKLKTPAPMANLFIENFNSTLTSGYYYVEHGFAQTSGPFPDYSGATFNITSPLYFSNGILGTNGLAQATAAPNGTYIQIYDRDYNPITGTATYPGASGGLAYVYGNTSFDPGLGVSLYDAHELAKELFIGSGPTYGEYGFSFTVTVPFTLSDGSQVTLTTIPMVDVFSISDKNQGNFSGNADYTQQDAATLAIYSAIMRGDFNLDGEKTAADIPLMLQALANPSAYKAANNNMSSMEFTAIADVNQDGVVSNADLQALLNLLAGGGGGTSSVPEPSAALLAWIALGCWLLVQWRRFIRLPRYLLLFRADCQHERHAPSPQALELQI